MPILALLMWAHWRHFSLPSWQLIVWGKPLVPNTLYFLHCHFHPFRAVFDLSRYVRKCPSASEEAAAITIYGYGHESWFFSLIRFCESGHSGIFGVRQFCEDELPPQAEFVRHVIKKIARRWDWYAVFISRCLIWGFIGSITLLSGESTAKLSISAPPPPLWCSFPFWSCCCWCCSRLSDVTVEEGCCWWCCHKIESYWLNEVGS